MKLSRRLISLAFRRGHKNTSTMGQEEILSIVGALIHEEYKFFLKLYTEDCIAPLGNYFISKDRMHAEDFIDSVKSFCISRSLDYIDELLDEENERDLLLAGQYNDELNYQAYGS